MLKFRGLFGSHPSSKAFLQVSMSSYFMPLAKRGWESAPFSIKKEKRFSILLKYAISIAVLL